AYHDVLLAEQQIVVQEASVKLLAQELENTTHRFEAGAVPRFDVLRGEVELANARPRLIRARNAHRIAKNNLATLLCHTLPPTARATAACSTISSAVSRAPSPACNSTGTFTTAA